MKKSLAMTGKRKSPEHIEKMRLAFSIPVHMYDIESRKYIKTFSSTVEAGKVL